METYIHIKTVLAIVLGLSITHSLKGAMKFIEHPKTQKPYAVHLLWAFYIFLSTVYFWWFEIHLSAITDWNFFKYFFLVLYVILYFILASLLFPDSLGDYKDYKTYFQSRRKWFFYILAILFIFDYLDTSLKGSTYNPAMLKIYPIREFTHIVACVVLANTNKRWFNWVAVFSFIIFQFLWIFNYFLRG